MSVSAFQTKSSLLYSVLLIDAEVLPGKGAVKCGAQRHPQDASAARALYCDVSR
jgi:hypothetical protein